MLHCACWNGKLQESVNWLLTMQEKSLKASTHPPNLPPTTQRPDSFTHPLAQAMMGVTELKHFGSITMKEPPPPASSCSFVAPGNLKLTKATTLLTQVLKLYFHLKDTCNGQSEQLSRTCHVKLLSSTSLLLLPLSVHVASLLKTCTFTKVRDNESSWTEHVKLHGNQIYKQDSLHCT